MWMYPFEEMDRLGFTGREGRWLVVQLANTATKGMRRMILKGDLSEMMEDDDS